MAKTLLVLLALVAVAVAKPMGGAMVSHGVSSHSHMMYPGMYGMLGMYPGMGLIGHSISSHSHIGHGIGMGYGMYGLGMKGLYPGLGMGYGYGMMG